MNCKHPTLYVLGPENKPAPYGYCMLCEVARLRSELDEARADMHAWEDTANDWKTKYDERGIRIDAARTQGSGE